MAGFAVLAALLSCPGEVSEKAGWHCVVQEAGKPVTVVMLGDSIVNDTWCGNVSALVKERFPQAKIVLSVRGSMDCWHYRDLAAFDSCVLRHTPDFLRVGGISNGKAEAGHSTAEEDMTAVIRLAQENGIEMYDSWVSRGSRSDRSGSAVRRSRSRHCTAFVPCCGFRLSLCGALSYN